ncbi:MAG: hypothetical protein K6A30_02225 [Lachnospiraceae bacterium]|nr:hypothetical protein [Lachnospiraceae bacterium]
MVSVMKLAVIIIMFVVSIRLRQRTDDTKEKKQKMKATGKTQSTAAQPKRASTYGTYVENMKKRESQPRTAEPVKPRVVKSELVKPKPVKPEPVKPVRVVNNVTTVKEPEEDLMKEVYDVMAMGPDYEISRERDFVAEGEKIISLI